MTQTVISSRSLSAMGIPDQSLAAFGGTVPPFALKDNVARKVGMTYEKGGGLGAIVSIAASIAIPALAPSLASSIGISTAIGNAIGSTMVGNVLGSAIVGAGLGAASSLVTKQKLGQAALMGFIGGGIGGYMSTPSTPTTGPLGARAGVATPGVETSQVGIANLGGTAEVVQPGPAGGWYTQAGQVVPADQIAYGGVVPADSIGGILSSSNPAQAAANAIAGSQTLVTNLPTAMGGNAAAFGNAQYYNPTQGGTEATAQFATQQAPAYQQAGLDVSKAAEASATKAAQAAQQPQSAWEAIKAKVSDPKAQADLVLRAAGQLAGSQMAGSGLSEEQQALVDAQKAELAQLQQTNRALFEQRLNEATNLIGEAKYFDPAYFGMQAERGVTTALARQKQQALREIAPGRGGLRTAEARRRDLEAATRGQTAYLQGANTAQTAKINTLNAGLNMLPTSGVNVYGSSSEEAALLRDAEAQRQTALKATGQLFGSITGEPASKALG